MTAHHDCDVLVVGAGPTGITLALLLAQAGVRVIAIDREADIYPLPRAAHIDHETVRIFQKLGVATEILAASRRTDRYDFLTADGQVLMRFGGSDRIGPGGWPRANMIHQPSLERTLRTAASRCPNLALWTAAAWTSGAPTADGVLSRIGTAAGERIVSSRFIVGCDGARSPVRTAAGIGEDDLHFDEPWLVIDTIVHDASRLPAINLQICDPARPTTCVLMGAGRHRWEFMLKPGETAEDVTQDAFIEALLAPWNVAGAVSLERKVVYRFNARIAKTWRKGSVMLAGDAAHVMPPFAGQGLCSGIRDADNVAWKIAAVLAGADAGLLDTYQLERAPHVRGFIDLAIMMGRTVCITDPAAAQARDAQMLAARATDSTPNAPPPTLPFSDGCVLDGAPGAGAYFPQPVSGDARLDDALGPGAWLIGASADAIGLRTVALGDPIMAPFSADLTQWLDAHDAPCVLVRPDRYVFGAGAANVLLAAWSARMKG